MVVNWIILFFGIFLLIICSDWLVDGASSLAKKFGVSELLIALTIVSFGTSFPEVLVNILASFKGSYDIGMGNIVGSNISNTLLVLGVAAIVGGIKFDSGTINQNIPFSILSVIVLFVLANGTIINGNGDSGLFRSGGIVLLCFFIVFMHLSFKETKDLEQKKVKTRKLWLSWLMLIGGLTGIYFGAKLTVDKAEIIARSLGMSEALIGITVIGLGTSLPELAVCTNAAFKKQYGIVIGNVVGSNIFNILWVLGVSSIIKPIEYSPILDLDIGLVLISSIILFPLILFGKKNHLSRGGGIVLVGLYLIYLIFVLIRG